MADSHPKPVYSEFLPASWDAYDLIEAFWQAPSYHLIFEVLLILWIVQLMFKKSYKPHRTTLSKKEEEELIREYEPEPLAPVTSQDHPALQNMENRIISGKVGKYIQLNGKQCLNLASLNFLGMVGRPEIEEASVSSLRKYGVGACGPRGFYGTVDVHLNLEESLQAFLGCEEAIVYSYGFAAISSAIPAYSKRGDVIFCDSGVNFAVEQGVKASRSTVHYFRHNDMQHLEQLLQEQSAEDAKNPKKAKATRRFLVVEGLYLNYGDVCPLPELLQLKETYKLRLFIDEGSSFGTLGASGRGITEHFGVSVDDVDLISGSLECAMGTCGGFCAGKAYVVDHQRLSGLGYCFSASTPPMLSQAAITAIQLLQDSPDMVKTLQEQSKYLHSLLSNVPKMRLSGLDVSPIKHLYIDDSLGSRDDDMMQLIQLTKAVESHGVAITPAAYLEVEPFLPQPSIRIAVNYTLTRTELETAASIIQESAQSVLL